MKPPVPHQPPLLLLLAVSFALFTGSFVFNQALRWTNPVDGFLNGLFHVMFTGPAWLVMGLIPGLLIHGLYRWRGWKRFRSVAIIFPGLVCFIMGLADLITSPPTAAGRLRSTGGADLPSSARDILTRFTGGGLTDYTDIYYFRCSPADTGQLIQALQLELVEEKARVGQFPRVPPGWPDPSTWHGSTAYERWIEERGRSYILLTDSSREQVYFFFSAM